MLPLQGAQVQSLVKELRSHKLHVVVKINKLIKIKLGRGISHKGKPRRQMRKIKHSD